MFKSKTLFILGAGASVEFGFPTGDGLKSEISGKLNIIFPDGRIQEGGDTTITDALREHCRELGSNDINPYLHASWKIRDAMPQSLSIDNFLDAHQNDDKVKLCGKLAIASSIIEAERRSFLRPELNKENVNSRSYIDSWLIPFAQRLTEGKKVEELGSILKDLSFIVFNYDRCLEVGLFYILQNYFFVSASEAAFAVNKAAIFHPYGCLGRLPWQVQSGSTRTVEFGEKLYGRDLLKVAAQIKTFTEQVDDDDLMRNVKEKFHQAEKIVFLGFGFHDLNMKLIAAENKHVCEIYGTTYNMPSSDVEVTKSILKRTLQRSDLPTLNIANFKCKQLLE